jgi:hypothetical protein
MRCILFACHIDLCNETQLTVWSYNCVWLKVYVPGALTMVLYKRKNMIVVTCTRKGVVV